MTSKEICIPKPQSLSVPWAEDVIVVIVYYCFQMVFGVLPESGGTNLKARVGGVAGCLVYIPLPSHFIGAFGRVIPQFRKPSDPFYAMDTQHGKVKSCIPRSRAVSDDPR